MEKNNKLYDHMVRDFKIMADRRREHNIRKYGTEKQIMRLNREQGKRKCHFCGVTFKKEFTQKMFLSGRNYRICFGCMERRNCNG